MNDFIGNHIRFIVEWGQLVTASVALVGLFVVYLATRRYRYHVPRTVLSWTICLAVMPFILVAGLAFVRITAMKPGAAPILARLDALQDRPAPPLSFHQVADGAAGSLTDLEGQVVLVNLWATWCAPCRSEMPELDRVQKAFAGRGLVVLAVSDEDRETLSRYLGEHPASFMTAYVESFDWVNMGNERPVTFLVDRGGIVREIFTGPWNEAFFSRQVERYL